MKEIKIKILVISQTTLKQSDLSIFKVGVNEKVNKILSIFQITEKVSGYLVFNGKIIPNPDEITFSKLAAGNMAQFSLCVGGGISDPVLWVRFPEFYLTDYYYMNVTYYDAVCFIPKTNVHFHGFGVMANYNSKDLTYKIKWSIDDDVSDEHEVSKVD